MTRIAPIPAAAVATTRSSLRQATLAIVLLALAAPAAHADPAETCARIGNDDTVRPYQRTLRQGFARAFKALFPDAKGSVSDTLLRDQGAFRCMDGKLYACFTGANLPCGKISTVRNNPAVDRYCAAAGTTDVVPLYVSGHDSAYSYRCVGGHGVIADEVWTLDRRGFAAKLWAPLD